LVNNATPVSAVGGRRTSRKFSL